MPLLLLSNRDSLRWIRGWFWVQTRKLVPRKCSPFPRRRGLRIVRDDFYLKKSSLIHSVAPPFQIEPAALGFDLVLGADLKAGASKLFALSTSEQSPLCSGVLLFLHLAVMRHFFLLVIYKFIKLDILISPKSGMMEASKKGYTIQ